MVSPTVPVLSAKTGVLILMVVRGITANDIAIFTSQLHAITLSHKTIYFVVFMPFAYNSMQYR